MTSEPDAPQPDTPEPDDKDWTRVLDRPCPECGFDAATLDPADVGAAIRDNARNWADVLRRQDVRRRPDARTWSALEYACHVRDVFTRFDERLHRMLDEDGPRFANWDQDTTAVAERYDRQDPGVVAGELAAAADVVAASFDAVRPDQVDRRGFRSDGAEFTVTSFGRYFVHDPVHHLYDVGR